MAKKTKKTLDPTLPIFQLKITLRHIQPLVWRRIQVDDCSLAELHDIIQISMGWDDEHMYAFVIDGKQCGDFEHGDDFDDDSRSVRLSEVVGEGHTRFRYDYDFGDDWAHTVDIEETLPAEQGAHYPRCVKGERACPPEDCGGPHEYPCFLDKIQDPQHEEHEEMLDWVGDEFDPEEFDLEQVNEELFHLRRFLGHGKGKHAAKTAFATGDLVRVKPGIAHDQYPDIPLGGWVGNISRIAWLTPAGYEIRWTKPTLAQAHPVFFKRCQRDGVEPGEYWVEADQLEKAADETPTTMDQPTSLSTRPLSTDQLEDQVRSVFGLTTDDPLPPVDEQNHKQFLDYLKANLTFPFDADYAAASVLGSDTSETVQILRFADPPIDLNDGILCEARKGKKHFQAALSNIQVHKDDPNFRHVEDYTFWLWEVQDSADDEEDEEDEEDGDDPDEWNAAIEGVRHPRKRAAIPHRHRGPLWPGRQDHDQDRGRRHHGGRRRANRPTLGCQRRDDEPARSHREIEQLVRQVPSHVRFRGSSDGNMGCPHEEGEDFPAGGDCPFCPWWKGKRGSGASASRRARRRTPAAARQRKAQRAGPADHVLSGRQKDRRRPLYARLPRLRAPAKRVFPSRPRSLPLQERIECVECCERAP